LLFVDELSFWVVKKRYLHQHDIIVADNTLE